MIDRIKQIEDKLATFEAKLFTTINRLNELIKRVDALENDFLWTRRKMNDVYEP